MGALKILFGTLRSNFHVNSVSIETILHMPPSSTVKKADYWFHVQNWTTRSTQSEVFHLEGTKVNMDETRCLDPQREVPTNREAEAPVSSERFRSVRHKQASAGGGVKRTPKRHVYCMGKPMYINQAFSFALALFLGSNMAWMLGSTPP